MTAEQIDDMLTAFIKETLADQARTAILLEHLRLEGFRASDHAEETKETA